MVDFNKKLEEMKRAKSMNQRLKDAVGASAAPSMVPFKPPPTPKEEEVIPDIREVVDNPSDLTKLVKLVKTYSEWQAQESEAKRAKKPLNEDIKKLLGKYSVVKAWCGGLKVNYFNSPRTSISKDLLLANGVSPLVIAKSTTTKDVYSLRITEPGQEDDET